VNRTEFRGIAQLRLAEAKLLLDAAHLDGAYYLSGCAVECALKAVIARQTRRHDFPPKVGDVRDMYTHDLAKLVRLALLDEERAERVRSCVTFARYWVIVRDWSEESRYHRWSEDDARTLFDAITDPRHGILRWLRKHW
jgi:HEPN domain-containing protein